MFFASNLHVEMLKTIVQTARSKDLGISTFLEVLLPALWGEYIFEKCTQKNNYVQHIVLGFSNLGRGANQETKNYLMVYQEMCQYAVLLFCVFGLPGPGTGLFQIDNEIQ